MNEQSSKLPGESAEEYITELYALVETCEYGDLTDDMLHDRIVIGIRNAAVSKCLQLDPDLSLEKAKCLVWQEEAVNDQQPLLKGDTSLPEALMVNGLQESKEIHNEAITMLQLGGPLPVHPEGHSKTGSKSASDVVTINMLAKKNVQQQVLPAISATKRDTTVLNVSQRLKIILISKPLLMNSVWTLL